MQNVTSELFRNAALRAPAPSPQLACILHSSQETVSFIHVKNRRYENPTNQHLISTASNRESCMDVSPLQGARMNLSGVVFTNSYNSRPEPQTLQSIPIDASCIASIS